MENFILIDKFGCFYDPMSKSTCPALVNGMPDASVEAICHIDDLDMGDDDNEALVEEINRILSEIKPLYIMKSFDIKLKATVTKTMTIEAGTEEEAIEIAHSTFSVLNTDSPEDYDEDLVSCKENVKA